MSLSEVRILFGYKTRMTKTAQNYKKLPKYAGEGAKCKFCLQYDSHSHLMRCSAFSHLRTEFCLDNDLHLVLLRWDHPGGILDSVEGFTGGEIYPDNLAVCYEI